MQNINSLTNKTFSESEIIYYFNFYINGFFFKVHF